MIKRTRILKNVVHTALILGLIALPAASQAQTATVIGYPANFDAVNNTGQVTRGFEIEADGIGKADLTRIFGANFIQSGGPCLIRYCEGTATDFAGGVYIRWMSPWDANALQFTQGTPLPNGSYVNGESCWTYGLGAAYPTSGCEHFGISSLRSPTQVIYRWLVEDQQNPGQLIRFAAAAGSGVAAPPPTPVAIPQPLVYVAPPVAPGLPPVVHFEIQLPPPPPPAPLLPPQYGDAQWVKVYVSQMQGEVDLNDLMLGNRAVPNDAQVETEWTLLQKNPHSAKSGILHHQGLLGNGNHAVVRRYAFYKYSGNYDALTHEALCGGDGACVAPLAGEQGDFIGNQMAAANIETPSVTVAKVGNGIVDGANGAVNCGANCMVAVSAGTQVSLTAITPGNAVFGGWTGACTGSDPACSLTVNKALNTTATFTPVFTLSVGRGGNGTIAGTPQGSFNTFINCENSCAAKFAQGTSVTLTATPTGSAKFVSWTGACSGTVPTCTLSIGKDTKAQANFK